MANRPIVVINYKAEVVAYYDSIKECAEVNGFKPKSVYYAALRGRILHCLKFISEPVYREHWMNGTLHELQFKTKEQRKQERLSNMMNARKSPEVENHRRQKIAESQKQRQAKGIRTWENATEARKKPVICIETGQTFPSVRAAARHFCVAISTISNAIHYGRKVSNAYHFRLLNDNNQKSGQ